MTASVLSKIAARTAKKETKRPAQKTADNRKPMACICAPFYPHSSDPDRTKQEFAQNIWEMIRTGRSHERAMSGYKMGIVMN